MSSKKLRELEMYVNLCVWTCSVVSCTLGFIPQCSPCPRVAICSGAGRSAVQALAGPSSGSQGWSKPAWAASRGCQPRTLQIWEFQLVPAGAWGFPYSIPGSEVQGVRVGWQHCRAVQGTDREISRRRREEVRALTQPRQQRPASTDGVGKALQRSGIFPSAEENS